MSLFKHLCLSALLCGLFSVSALAQPDSIKILTPEAYLELVGNFHPAAKRASLLNDQARAAMMSARGNFDPKAYTDWQQKVFRDKNYYGLLDAGFKIPFWYGGEIKASYGTASGYYLNPQNIQPTAGLANLGISMPLLQGLLIDQRRVAIRQAQIMEKSNTNDQQSILNSLYYEALMSYWNWSLAFKQEEIAERAYALASERLQAVVESALMGDRPAIDTTEAQIIVQERSFQLNAARLTRLNATIQLSLFWWSDNEAPLVPDATWRPQPLDLLVPEALPEATLDQSVQAALTAHPDLLAYEFKLQMLDWDKRLKADKLKPKLSVDYNVLAGSGDFIQDDGYGNPWGGNTKWGVSFSMPLFLRAERADLAMANLKIRDAELMMAQKQAEIVVKITESFNKISTGAQQVALYREIATNYRKLYDVERYRLSIGETSVFMANSRETKLIETEQKLAELTAKWQLDTIAFRWACGLR